MHFIDCFSFQLVFHTVNASKSAYACFTFKPDFFISYKEEPSEKRKVLLKVKMFLITLKQYLTEQLNFLTFKYFFKTRRHHEHLQTEKAHTAWILSCQCL